MAHSGGVIPTVRWAQQTRRTVKGALLATPPDFERPLPDGYPSLEALRKRRLAARCRAAPLAFPSIVAASRNDPLASFERVAAMARQWGSRLVDLGEVGHLNPASGYGDWPAADTLIAELEAETDVLLAESAPAFLRPKEIYTWPEPSVSIASAVPRYFASNRSTSAIPGPARRACATATSP